MVYEEALDRIVRELSEIVRELARINEHLEELILSEEEE